MPNSMIQKQANKFEDLPDVALTMALLAGAVIIALIAVFSHNKLFKAIVLAYIVLP